MEFFVQSLFFPVLVLIALHGLAVLPGIPLTWGAVSTWSRLGCLGRTLVGISVGFWLLYACYETYMHFWMKTVVAPTRADLLITPILYRAAIVGGAVLLAGRRGGTPPKPPLAGSDV